MPAKLMNTAAKANSGTDVCVGKSDRGRRLTVRVMRAARSIWPNKIAANLALIAGVAPRTAERWLSGEQELSADALARLIRSEAGLKFLSAVMVDASPKWWAYAKSATRIGAIRRQQEELQEALHEAKQLNAAIARAEVAMGNVDPDYFSFEIDEHRALRSDLDRAVAPRGRR